MGYCRSGSEVPRLFLRPLLPVAAATLAVMAAPASPAADSPADPGAAAATDSPSASAAPPASAGTKSGMDESEYPGIGNFGRIHYDDLEYLGAFKCPDSRAWAFAKGLVAYIPSRNTLVAVGKSFAELEIPPFVKSGNPADLHEAVSPTRMFDPMKDMRHKLKPANTLGGITWFEGRFWIGTYEFYNTAGRDNLGICSFDENWGDPRGPWRVGPPNVNKPIKDVFHANKTHGDVMVIPENWADTYTPGRRLAGGRTRGAGAFGSGRGPQLYAFEANVDTPEGRDLGGIPLMYFMERGVNWPNYHNADRYHSIWIWRGTRQAVIVGARKGLGEDHYGHGTSCSPDKGWHSEPYEPRMYFIDVNDLGAVALGKMKPWAVRAYEEVMPTEMWRAPGDPDYDPGCEQDWMRDWAFDSERGILYATQPEAYEVAREKSNRMIIHAWKVH